MTTLSLPLTDLKLITIEQYGAAPFGTMYLADLGAEVIKIERPGSGDLSRGRGPFVKGNDGKEVSSRFLGINRNKKKIGRAHV